MLDDGFVQLHRKITKWEWYGDSNTSRTFIHLLVTANYYDAQWRGIEVKKGQRISSYSVLAKELNLSVKEIRTAINHLKRTGEVAHQNCHEYGLFTVVHYFDYQGRAHQGADVGHTKGRPRAHEGQLINKANKANKDNKKDIPPLADENPIDYSQIERKWD